MLYKGEYSPATTYTKLDVVYQDSTKSSYISLQDNNIGKEPKDNPTFWGVISRAKYEVNDQDIKDAVTNIIATSDFKAGNMNIVTANPSIDFHFNNSEEPTSTIKEFSSGILQVPGSLVVIGDLIANANSARALDHPIQINGQDIQTVVNNNSKLTADVQVNTLKASTDLSDLSVYPSLNANYGLSGKYVASPNDSTSYTAVLQVSSYPDASHVRLTLIDTGTLGSIYTRTYTSGNWSTWQKVIIDSDTIAKASTAGKLAKAVSINGTAFDGSSDIAVNAANDSTLVHKSGNESIAGDKTFTGNVNFSGTSNIVSATTREQILDGYDLNGYADTYKYVINGAKNLVNYPSSASAWATLDVEKINQNTSTQTLTDTNNKVFIRTMGGNPPTWSSWIELANDSQLVHNTGNESIAGDKKFSGKVTVDNASKYPLNASVPLNSMKMLYGTISAVRVGNIVQATYNKPSSAGKVDVNTTSVESIPEDFRPIVGVKGNGTDSVGGTIDIILNHNGTLRIGNTYIDSGKSATITFTYPVL